MFACASVSADGVHSGAGIQTVIIGCAMKRIRPLGLVIVLSAAVLVPACNRENTQPSTPTTPTPTSPTSPTSPTPPEPTEPPTTPPQPLGCTYAAAAEPDDFEPDGGN